MTDVLDRITILIPIFAQILSNTYT